MAFQPCVWLLLFLVYFIDYFCCIEANQELYLSHTFISVDGNEVICR